jgi:hypothetical protein
MTNLEDEDELTGRGVGVLVRNVLGHHLLLKVIMMMT